MTTAIMFEPRTQRQIDLLTSLAEQLRIAFNYIPKKEVKTIKQAANPTTLAAIKEAKEGQCVQYADFDDFKQQMYAL